VNSSLSASAIEDMRSSIAMSTSPVLSLNRPCSRSGSMWADREFGYTCGSTSQ